LHRNIFQELTQLGQLGENEKANWWSDLLLLNEKTLAVAAPPVSPEEHLQAAKYMDVIERNSGAPERDARVCVWSEYALNKCRSLARAAFSRYNHVQDTQISILDQLTHFKINLIPWSFCYLKSKKFRIENVNE